ncbi:hypothetical protein [uncultured Tenacibaculum sp.]|uniref:hypothetical protein n=1 Tax=uncultured Tenacibaculum sp. TaxID=174713 RepID=UPI00261EA7EA|nr:hypothetical protein [uncultured Tenacibaculum sp.]
MLGFGAASEMQKTVKNLRRKPISSFEKIKDLNSSSGKIEKKEVSQKELAAIREKVQKENRIRTIRFALFLIISIIILTYFIGFYKY